MSRDFELLLEHLRNRTGEVELAVPAPQGNGDAATAARMDSWREITAFGRGSALTRVASALFQHPANVDPEDARSNPNLQQSSQTMIPLVGPARLLRLDPDGMRRPTDLIPRDNQSSMA